MKTVICLIGLWLSCILPSLVYSEEIEYTRFIEITKKYVVNSFHQEILWAIAFIESSNGLILGEYSTLGIYTDQLESTNKGRGKFAKANISALIKFAIRTNRKVSDFYGSEGGAMGYMQFIPSTFDLFAQDGDEDGIKDPLNDEDSVATAAYFFAYNYAKIKRQVYGDQKLNKNQDHRIVQKTLRAYNNSNKYVLDVVKLAQR